MTLRFSALVISAEALNIYQKAYSLRTSGRCSDSEEIVICKSTCFMHARRELLLCFAATMTRMTRECKPSRWSAPHSLADCLASCKLDRAPLHPLAFQELHDFNSFKD